MMAARRTFIDSASLPTPNGEDVGIGGGEALAGEAEVSRFSAVLVESVFLGATIEHRLRLPGGDTLTMREGRSGAAALPDPGAQMALAFRNADAVILTDC